MPALDHPVNHQKYDLRLPVLWLIIHLDEYKPVILQNEYKEKDGKEYLDVTIKSPDFEAHTLMLVKEWDKTMEVIKEFKGKGYGGSEMVNLKYEIVQDSVKTEFVYVSADELID